MTTAVVAHEVIAHHGAHLGAIVVPTVLMTGYALVAEVRARRRERQPQQRTGGRTVIQAAAYLSVLAGIIHVAVAPEHFHESWLYGSFFVGSAAFQLAWAAGVLVRRTPRLLLVGLVANVGVALLWAVTRTVGIPLGPESGTVEAVGRLDVISTLAELGIAAGAALVLVRFSARSRAAQPDY